jgi:hypothetical protein
MTAGLTLLLLLTILAAASLIVYGWRNGVTPVPSSPGTVQVMSAEAAREAAEMSGPEDRCWKEDAAYSLSPRLSAAAGELTVLEPGCGWGGLALALAERLPGARVIGFENSPVPFLFSLLRARAAGLPNLRLRWGDYRRFDFSRADIVVCYLYPGAMEEIAGLLRELEEGQRPTLISNTFALPGRNPDRRLPAGDAALSPIYLYRGGRSTSGRGE